MMRHILRHSSTKRDDGMCTMWCGHLVQRHDNYTFLFSITRAVYLILYPRRNVEIRGIDLCKDCWDAIYASITKTEGE